MPCLLPEKERTATGVRLKVNECRDLNEAYAKPPFSLEVKGSDFITIVFVGALFNSYSQIIIPLFAVYLGVSLFIERLNCKAISIKLDLVLRYQALPLYYTESIHNLMVRSIVVAFLAHLLLTLWTFSSPDIFNADYESYNSETGIFTFKEYSF